MGGEFREAACRSRPVMASVDRVVFVLICIIRSAKGDMLETVFIPLMWLKK